MAQKKTQKKKGGEKKYGRNKRPANAFLSAYVRGKISFDEYKRLTDDR